MIELKQTKTGKEGNCLQTVIASMLELKIEQVPDFANIYSNEDWFSECSKWLSPKGLGMIAMTINTEECIDILEDNNGYTGFYIGDLKQSHRPYNHVVIMKGHEIVHDPDPTSKHKDWKTTPMNAFFIVVDDIKKLRSFLLSDFSRPSLPLKACPMCHNPIREDQVYCQHCSKDIQECGREE